jgi:hypothetical protein
MLCKLAIGIPPPSFVYRVHHLISLAGRVEGSNVVSHSRLDAVWQPLDSPAASRKNGVWGGGELDAIEMTRLVHFIFIREESDPSPSPNFLL